jgi:hypothetical protein
MNNTGYAIVSILLVSVLLSSGCKSKKPPAEPTTEPQAKPPAEPQAKPTPEPETNAEAEKAAVESARAWLELIDAGEYEQSWQEAALYVRNLVPKDDWQRSMQGARQPLGKLISRELKATHYTTSAPGAPDGEYVIIQYNSSFENKKSAVETVTPMLEQDGTWRVSGYYIK